MKLPIILLGLLFAMFGAASFGILIVTATARDLCGWGWSIAL